MAKPPPHVYSLAEIAAHLPLAGNDKERTVRRLIRDYKIPYHKTGRAVGLDDKQLGQLLADRFGRGVFAARSSRSRNASATERSRTWRRPILP